MDYLCLGLACEELEYIDTSLRVIMSVHLGLNCLTLLTWGTEDQKQRYLVPQAQGVQIAGYGLTEPSAGSDARGIQSVAVKKGDRYVLTGEKSWISLAEIADNFLVIAWTDVEKKRQRDPAGLSAFIVERGFKGFASGPLKEKWGISAWKTYTQWGADGKGFFLTDDVGIRFIEKARKLGVKNIAVHKGLPFGSRSYEHSQCSDIGVVAKRFPDVNFLIYHSGFVTGVPEQGYTPGRDGIDTLVASLQKNGVPPGSNVYAELGSTWRFLMRDPDQAAHAIGKLVKHCGPDNVLWGTDSIWYGSPQDQIQAFRAFQIAPRLREQHGYGEITPELRAKIFGRNAAKVYGLSAADIKKYSASDRIARERSAYLENPEPHFRTYGPKTRREFLRYLRLSTG